MLLYEIVNIFDEKKINYALIGGYALALHGLVRATVDVDLILSLRLNDFQLAEAALAQIGLKSRLPIRAEDVIKMRQEYIEKRNLLAWSFVDYKKPHRQVDILITHDLRKVKTEMMTVGGKKMKVITLKELLKMKLEAGRPQDLLDAENIKAKLSLERKNT
ncbi:MAG: nucleotidyl transferase AbiEii/AbiGii toxin family protein [Bdellovibrio sp.]|nr:nucleotidyl transferase AbiEii/AbiGii toxin family protein [Bdellovibrio sp.]